LQGIIIQTGGNQHCQQLHISVLSPPASSSLQAEAFGPLLATMLAELLHIPLPCCLNCFTYRNQDSTQIDLSWLLWRHHLQGLRSLGN
jgi:hypothetical protein